ncbi:MAG: ABC transporter permease [Candidatus Wenzhouxiangella sp. M2_3B_020]
MIVSMTGTVARIMWLGVLRDRGALALAFVLPPLMFLVFAEVFSGAGENDLEMRVAIADSAGTPLSGEIASALSGAEGMVPVQGPAAGDRAALERLVRRGQADAAVWLRAEPGGDLDADPPIVVIGDASRELAAAVVAGRVQQVLRTRFPELGIQRAASLIDALAGPYTEEQRESIRLALEDAGADEAASDAEGAGRDGLVARELLGGGRGFDDGVSYYAGAVAILFLLFAAMQGAISLIDERNAGIVDRLMAGPGGYTVVVFGKGLFLTLQGLVQAGLIFAVAWLLYGLDWPAHFGTWLVTALLAAAVSAWLGLLLASLCSSRQQAQTASAFVVLILSAVGGSMMPRFLMPGWLRELGWITPNAWVIESWQGMFWRGEGPAELAFGWLVLSGAALIAMLLTMALTRRLADVK